MKALFLAFCGLVVLASCRDEKLQKAQKCGLPCYESPIGYPGIGQCKSGYWLCSGEDDSTATCEEQTVGTPELCDGLDNNCNGRVDENLWQECKNECGVGAERCGDGQWLGCTAPVPAPETCDGRDNDCNGETDDNLPVEFCYSGPPGTVSNGTCQPGVTKCQFGVKTCYGEQLPSGEACDGLDNDCNGKIDDTAKRPPLTDFVFVIDNSGSMGSFISAIKLAVSDFAQTYQTETSIKWALVAAPDTDWASNMQVKVVKNLGSVAAFKAAIYTQSDLGGSDEPTLDALFMLTDSSNPLNISWTPGSNRVVVLFTDEEPQSYLTPPVSTLEVNSSIASSNTQVHIFTTNYYAPQWRTVGNTNQVSIQQLVGLPSTMTTALRGLIQGAVCK